MLNVIPSPPQKRGKGSERQEGIRANLSGWESVSEKTRSFPS